MIEYASFVMGVCCGVLCPMITTLGMRGYLYGIRDVNVLRMGFYLIFPRALAVTLDVLFKLIRMYRISLQMKLKKEECVVCKESGERNVMLDTQTSPIVS